MKVNAGEHILRTYLELSVYMPSLVVIFGDPDNGQAVGSITESNVDVFCHAGDDICQGGDLILPAHLTYGLDAGSAASFVAGKVGL